MTQNAQPPQLRFILKMLLIASLLVSANCSPPLPDGPVYSATPNAQPINQILIHRNGCGPIALMNAYQFGNDQWRHAYSYIKGKNDKEKFTTLIRKYGIHISKHDGQVRWNSRNGINSLDLTDLANQYQHQFNKNLPQLKLNTLFVSQRETHQDLLNRTHKSLRNSLHKGFPPILSIKRFAKRTFGNMSMWKQVHGHFVVLHRIPSRIPSNASEFEVQYIDSWGGTIKTGSIKIPKAGFFALDITDKTHKWQRSPTLEIDFPQSNLGKNRLKKGEKSVTVISSSIHP